MSAVQDAGQIVADQHLRDRDMVVLFEHPDLFETRAVAGSPIRLGPPRSLVSRRAPLLDEHSLLYADQGAHLP